MCDFSFSGRETLSRYGDLAKPILTDAQAAIESDIDGFIERTQDGFKLTAKGQPFVRNVCARFDAYLPREAGTRRHALSV